MIHVCFSIYDPTGQYSKYLGVAIYSLLKNTNSEVCIHIIHDDTLSYENKMHLESVVRNFQQDISFHLVNGEEFSSFNDVVHVFTIGTLFRLKIPDLLDNDINKVIYLDADIVVNVDVKKLWCIDLNGCLIGACRDAVDAPRPLCNAGLVTRDDYFNAGVMVMNLDAIRKVMDFSRECHDYFANYPNFGFADQDALNLLFRHNVKYLPSRYNIFTVNFTKKDVITDEYGMGIFHFAGDKVNIGRSAYFDKLFVKYLVQTPWIRDRGSLDLFFDTVKDLSRRNCTLNIVMRSFLVDRKKKIFWGAKSILKNRIFDLIGSDGAYFVDNDLYLNGTSVNNLTVYLPDELMKEEKSSFLLIVLSQKAYEKIKQQLEEYGLKEYYDLVQCSISHRLDQSAADTECEQLDIAQKYAYCIS